MAGYGSDDGLDTWLAEQGYVLPTGSPTNAVLRQRGSVYLDGAYGNRFPGEPTSGDQERAWPRTNAVDRYGNALSGIPARVINASYQAAYLEALKPGFLFKTYTPGQNKVLTEVKGIKWQVVGDKTSNTSMIPVSTAIEGILQPILTASGLPAILVV